MPSVSVSSELEAMKIDRVEMRLIRMPLVSPFETSFGVEEVEEHIVVRADGGGITGWGECVASTGPWYSYETNQTAWHVLRDYLIPLLFEGELEGPRQFPAKVMRVRGHQMAKAGLEAALWDWTAKEQGKSLAQVFGANRDRIPVGVSIGLQSSTDALVDRVGEYLSEGYSRIKIKIKPNRDLDLVRSVRRSFPNVPLQVDANSAYELSQAQVFIEMDQFGLLLIEQPLAEDDLYQHSKLQPTLKTPLCLDESIPSAEHASAALAMGACKIINIKAGRVGGFTEAIKIHDLCKERGAPVWCGGMLESGIGRAGNVALASLSNFTLPGDLSASRRYFLQDIVEPEFAIEKDGTMKVPRDPGIGVMVLEQGLEQITVQHAEFRRG
jgi:o-succinylbenzoate synthase